MQMAAGGMARCAHQPDPVAVANRLSGPHQRAFEMRIARGQTLSVIDHHQIAIATRPLRAQHFAGACGNHVAALRGRQVDARVQAHPQPERIGANPERRGFAAKRRHGDRSGKHAARRVGPIDCNRAGRGPARQGACGAVACGQDHGGGRIGRRGVAGLRRTHQSKAVHERDQNRLPHGTNITPRQFYHSADFTGRFHGGDGSQNEGYPHE